MLILQKIFLVTISQQRDVAPNTLPTNRERIFMLVFRKIFLSTNHSSVTLHPIKLGFGRVLFFTIAPMKSSL